MLRFNTVLLGVLTTVLLAAPSMRASDAAKKPVGEPDASEKSFQTISLAPLADSTITPKDDWPDRIWKFPIQQLPRGRQEFAGIPFYVIPAEANGGRAAVTLVGGHYPNGPRGGGTLAVGHRAAAIYFLHTASYWNNNAGRVAAEYALHYDDGTTCEIPIRNLYEIADLMTAENPSSNCAVGWSVKHSTFPYHYAVFVVRHVNPHPELRIASIEFRPTRSAATVAVLGVTLCDDTPPLAPRKEIKPLARPTPVLAPAGRLDVTILDGAAATPARVAVQGPQGKYYQPADGLNYALLTRGTRFFYADGRFSLPVPAGPVQLRICKGFEYQPLELTVDVPADKTLSRTVALKRWIDLPRLGWYSGEMHIHPADQEPADLSICLRAEDLHVANLMASSTGFSHRCDADQFFRGRPESWPGNGYVAYYNEEYRNNTFGHMCLINLKHYWRPTGSGSEYSIEDYPPNATLLDWTHAQGGYASIAHLNIPPVQYATPWEAAVDIALGKADSVDITLPNLDRSKNWALDLWYRFLNCGYRLPATCGTDAGMCYASTCQPLGNLRVCGLIGPHFSYAGWVEAMRAGKSFVTQGPVVLLTVEGQGPGETIPLKPGINRLRIHAEAQSPHVLHRLEIVANGQVVASVKGNGTSRLVFDDTIELKQGAWVAARTESDSSWAFLTRSLIAHTNPIYCLRPAEVLRSTDDARFFAKQIDGLLDWVEHKGSYHDPKHKAEVKALFAKARAIYEKQAAVAEISR